jgi:hypothetical protein
MVTNYPATIDTSQNLPIVIDNSTPVSASIVNGLRGAIIAIEQALGVNPGSPYGTVSNRLTILENSIGNLQSITLTKDLGGTFAQPLVVGLQGNPISSTTPGTGQVLTWNGTAWVPIFPAISPALAISLSGPPAFVEIGQALVNPIFNATYNPAPIAASIQDNLGNPSQNVFTAAPPSVPPDIFVYSESYEFNSYPVIPFSVTFTLNASNGTGTVTDSITTTWVQKLYYGTAAPGGNTAAFIQALSNSPLSNTKTTFFSVDAGAGQAIYFAYRTAYGTADFWVDGFEGGFDLISNSIAVTNAYGFTENYTLYQSSQVGLGATTVNVF